MQQLRRLMPLEWPAGWGPPMLEVLRGTSINCLLAEKPDPSLESAAQKAGLRVFRDPAQAGVHLVEGVWPGVQSPSKGDRDSAEAGPTGAPWVDSNLWRLQLARAQAPGKPVWVTARPPGEDRTGKPASYELAVADAAALDAQWVVALSGSLAKSLEKGEPQAVECWKAIHRSLAYFARRGGLEGLEPTGPLGVLSDFAGDNEFLAAETLNLAARRQLFFRVLVKPRADFQGLRAVLYTDSEPPEPGLVKRLAAFAQAGGLVIAPASTAALLGGGEVLESPVPGYSVRRLGKGRVAAPEKPWDDPYLLAGDAHILLSHRYDPLLLFNAGAMGVAYARSRDGKRALVQLLNYSQREPSHEVTLGLTGLYPSARFSSLNAPEPAPLKLARVKRGVEAPLPPFSVYARIEVGGVNA